MIELIICIAFTVFCAIIDVEHLQKKQYIVSHTSRFLQRSAFVAALFLVSLETGILGVCIFVALFDSVLNILWGKGVFYIGKVSVVDVFFFNKKMFWILIKIIALLGAVYITSLNFN